MAKPMTASSTLAAGPKKTGEYELCTIARDDRVNFGFSISPSDSQIEIQNQCSHAHKIGHGEANDHKNGEQDSMLAVEAEQQIDKHPKSADRIGDYSWRGQCVEMKELGDSQSGNDRDHRVRPL